MRVRRGFDRLCVVGYFLWLVLLTLGALWETSESRARYKWEEQSLSDEDRVNVTAPDGKLGSVPRSQLEDALKRGYKLTPSEVLGQPVYRNGKLIGYTTDGKTMTPVTQFDVVQREELVRLGDKTTFLVTVRSHFASWTGWVLAVFLPAGVYLLSLATGYTARWVYRGFSHGPR